MMRKLIIKSNEWYEDLSELKRDLFFLIVIFGSLLVVQVLMYTQDNPWGFVVWATVFTTWRLSYIIIRRKKAWDELCAPKEEHDAMSDVNDNETIFEKARRALHEELLANPEKIRKDLQEMRDKSHNRYYYNFKGTANPIPRCKSGEHYYMNAGLLQGVAMKRCTKCNDYVEAKGL